MSPRAFALALTLAIVLAASAAAFADSTPESTAAALVAQGLPDPRGADYREIEIGVASVWSGEVAPLTTHGWMLASSPGNALAWNGVVYRPTRVGARADVGADVDAMLAADAAAIARQKRDNPGWTPWRRPETAESLLVATTSVTRIKAILLLRLGDRARAARVWTAATHGTDERSDPYCATVDDWLWSQYDRGITAHERGDVALAVASWSPLPTQAARVASACPAPVQFLDHIDELLADERRRAATPMPALDDDKAIAALATLPQPVRIARLIAGLDQVSARQWGQPGGVSLGEDRIVRALIAEGPAAVDPLIATFETDDRLTRSVSFGRDFARYRSVLAVYEAAYVALTGLLGSSFFTANSTADNLTAHGHDGRRAVAAEIRAYWAKWRGVSALDRAYQQLADDHAPSLWLAAAAAITLPSNVEVVPGSGAFQATYTASLAPGEHAKLAGETLRKKTAPSVSELLARRLTTATEWRVQCSLAQAAIAWDPAASRAPVGKLVAELDAGFAARAGDKPYLGQCLAELANARADAGDPAALTDYAGWLATTSPADAQFATEAWFAPMAAHPRAAPIVAIAAKLFAVGSPWVPFTRREAGAYELELLPHELLAIPAFRAHVLTALADLTAIGAVKVRSDDVLFQTATFSSGDGFERGETHRPAAGTTMPLRSCDLYALYLGRRAGAPKFHIYWSVPERDAAIANLASWVRAQP